MQKNPIKHCSNCRCEISSGADKWCQPCYHKVTKIPESERFLAHIIKSNSCWTWRGRKDSHGYGQFQITWDTPYKVIKAHRYSWIFFVGEIPKNIGVLHKCDNPSCVNPAHLFLGTQKDNMRDCASKGRTTRGESHALAKVTENQVREIRAIYERDKNKAKEFGKAIGLSRAGINHLTFRTRWKHI